MNIDILLCINSLFNLDGIGNYITKADIIITIINYLYFMPKEIKL